jgi:hypothetical protein
LGAKVDDWLKRHPHCLERAIEAGLQSGPVASEPLLLAEKAERVALHSSDSVQPARPLHDPD